MTAPILFITGTDTEVGKTITTAAIASALRSQGLRIAVIKPTQTGLLPGESGDIAEVERLAGVEGIETFEFFRLPDPLAPDAAARRSGIALPPASDHATKIADIAARNDIDTVLVEGAGGLLVNLDADGGTLRELAEELNARGLRTGFILVVAARLGTLNVTALSAEALRAKGLELVGFVIGSYPKNPGLAERTNVDDLPRAAGAPCLGSIPEGAGALEPSEFQQHASDWVRL